MTHYVSKCNLQTPTVLAKLAFKVGPRLMATQSTCMFWMWLSLEIEGLGCHKWLHLKSNYEEGNLHTLSIWGTIPSLYWQGYYLNKDRLICKASLACFNYV